MSQETLRPTLSVDTEHGRELERRRVLQRMLYWARRFDLITDDWQRQLSRKQQSEWLHGEQHRLELFQRWQDLSYLRWAMYEEQRKYIERHGNSALGVSIWDILWAEQKDLEEQLQLDELQGESVHSFTSSLDYPHTHPSSLQPSSRWRPSKSQWRNATRQSGLGFMGTDGHGEDSFFDGTTGTEFESEDEVETINLLPNQSKRHYVEFDEMKDLNARKLNNIMQSVARADWLMQQIIDPYLKMNGQPAMPVEQEMSYWKEQPLQQQQEQERSFGMKHPLQQQEPQRILDLKQPVQQERTMSLDQAVDEHLKSSFEMEQALRMKSYAMEQQKQRKNFKMGRRRNFEQGPTIQQKRERHFDPKLERRSYDIGHPVQQEQTGSFKPQLDQKRSFELKERSFDHGQERTFNRGYPVLQGQRSSFEQGYPVQQRSHSLKPESNYDLERKRGYVLEYPKELEVQRNYELEKKRGFVQGSFKELEEQRSYKLEKKRDYMLEFPKELEEQRNYELEKNRGFVQGSLKELEEQRRADLDRDLLDNRRNFELKRKRSYELEFPEELEEERSFDLNFLPALDEKSSSELDRELEELYNSYRHSSTPED